MHMDSWGDQEAGHSVCVCVCACVCVRWRCDMAVYLEGWPQCELGSVCRPEVCRCLVLQPLPARLIDAEGAVRIESQLWAALARDRAGTHRKKTMFGAKAAGSTLWDMDKAGLVLW